MTTKEEMHLLIDEMSDTTVTKLMNLYYILIDDEKYDENGNVVVDEFYQKLLDEITQEKDDEVYTQDEVMAILGLNL
ncbi:MULTISPECIES: hypothetical protein [unclassified Granulicatella]|uniref:hypothetical protein n=1 Tax=unclassified Granulicatella TaxID=2630493 RepID=UPI0010739DEA|nr:MULTISPECIES: hypothetical protein [unclassified Granulicatella]MBF0780293.1 hypothetical protein [Granulicatella sp. 19428wC4_WM01]TFU95571.1 hypothetical protein E4T68_04195 [Granulicatella sp. WM01]